MADKILVVVLRLIGISALFAVVPVVMPDAWMIGIHRWLGLGELPEAPIVGYLARTLSAFYVLFGVLLLVIASDLERYRTLLKLLGLSQIVMGLAFLGIDLTAGLPWWWTATEGPFDIGFGILVLLLARTQTAET